MSIEKAERRGADRTELTHERLLAVLDYDPLTGVFTRKIGGRGIGNKVGNIAGSFDSDGYILISIDSKRYRAHRLAWLYMTGKFPDCQIDHINGISDDNRLVNLRDVTSSENLQNQRKARSNNGTGFLGVHKAAKKFVSKISLGGKTNHLGYFPTAELAHGAYLTAKRQLHPCCTI